MLALLSENQLLKLEYDLHAELLLREQGNPPASLAREDIPWCERYQCLAMMMMRGLSDLDLYKLQILYAEELDRRQNCDWRVRHLVEYPRIRLFRRNMSPLLLDNWWSIWSDLLGYAKQTSMHMQPICHSKAFPVSMSANGSSSNISLLPQLETAESALISGKSSQSETFRTNIGPESGEHLDFPYGASKRSSSSSFVTAKSSAASGSFYTASGGTSLRTLSQLSMMQENSQYAALLQSIGLLPVDASTEKDWCGRGQHAEFRTNEKDKLQKILKRQKLLGSTPNAVVESVKCRRILLARKTVNCNERFTREMAIQEVAHLQKLRHLHIIQVVGTYVMETELAILLYPVADFNLERFMQSARGIYGDGLLPHFSEHKELKAAHRALFGSFRCLSNAMKYIHGNITKHMDIKPQNILVRKLRQDQQSGLLYNAYNAYRVYIADFGIARSYNTHTDSETEGPTMFTRKYAAPEVVDRDRRGLAADVFSMGCVFAEILDVIAPPWERGGRADRSPRQRLESVRKSNEYGDLSYQANIPQVQEWLLTLLPETSFYPHFPVDLLCPVVVSMLNINPSDRPSAESVATSFGASETCCSDSTEPESLEVMPDESTSPDADSKVRYGLKRLGIIKE
ncbi:kinase-like protein [Mytilinidion resinicola]|uniref:Kinase-like protein n=1 Tax=Mytilinidion resinicola TaxID=574789 RepID=A0A6A6YL83_9PEZI|nr:kinase-like protein [Mytilinidion resinicola]KAF2808734.1 kinase-like protein [Mytilinidion resinicola]